MSILEYKVFFPAPGTRTNGLVGDIRKVTKRGWYITPFGYLEVLDTDPLRMQLLAYDGMLAVARYNNRMSTGTRGSPPHSWKRTKHLGSRTNRGFK